MKRKHYYATHRWLGLLVGVQLLLWSAGGFIFATHDIEWVRGNEGRSRQETAPIAFETVKLTSAKAATLSGVKSVKEVQLGTVLGRAVYEVRGQGAKALVDAGTGDVLSPISEKMAVEIAKADREVTPEVVSATLVTADPDTEYRKKPLPAWRVDLGDADNTHIYVEATTGRITARRNTAWRRFDFFWMLHTMDYADRDDFNTPWLIIVASLGLISVLSGWTLWLLRIRRRRKPGALTAD